MTPNTTEILHTCPRCEGEVREEWHYCPNCSMALEVPAGEQATLSDRIRYIRRDSEVRSRRQAVYRWGLTVASMLTVLLVVGGGILLFHPAFVPALFRPKELPVVEIPSTERQPPEVPPAAVLDFQWVTIPAGKFRFGEPGRTQEVDLDAFEIMKYEVTNAQWLDYLESERNRLMRLDRFKGSVPRNWNWDPDSGEFPEVPLKLLDRPVVHITWSQANDFCCIYLPQKLKCGTAYLPTSEEWEKAARGPDDERRYPWGDHAGKIRDGGLVPLCNVRETGVRAPVDVTDYEADRSYYGAQGMGGNVSEFVGYVAQNLWAIRGGSFDDPAVDAQVHFETQITPFSTFTYRNVGFRAARPVED